MKKNILLLLIFSCAFGLMAQNVDSKVVPNVYIAKLKKNTHKSTAMQTLQTYFGKNAPISIEKTFPQHQPLTQKANSSLVDLSLIYTITLSDNVSNKTLSELRNSGYFEYIQPKYTHQYLYKPNDNYVDNQWHLSAIKAFEAWDICTGDTNVVIGILDSGIDTTYVDLMENIKYNYDDPIDGIDNDNDGFIDNFWGWNMADQNNNISPNSVHGTFVAALAAAKTDNEKGLAGVGFNCKFLPIRIENSTWGIINGYEAIVYAADHGCQIINCSWGGVSPFDQFGQDVINYATYNKGALVVAACGNTPERLTFYPAAYDNVLSVAATQSSGNMADFSTYDYSVDICAPGQAVYSSDGKTYYASNGTSFSAPIVSGVAALLKSKYPEMIPQQIIHRLKSTADSIYISSDNDKYNKIGAGCVNAYRALTDSFRPSVEMINISYNQDAKYLNDTINIYGTIINYLSNAKNVQIEATLSDNILNIVNQPFQIGKLDSLQTYSTKEPMFVLQLTQNVENCQEVMLHLRFFSDSICIGSQHISIILNTTITMNVNNQICTITDFGRLGYDDDFFRFGNGISYQNGANLLDQGTFLFGNNASRISDNIRSINYSNREMKNIVLPHLVETQNIDMHVQTIFNDDNAENDKLNIETIHNAYAWKDSLLNNTVVHQYLLINKSTETISQLYAALYMDWDIDLGKANKIQYDNERKISFVQSVFGGTCAGVKFLTEQPNKVYAFDNNGSNFSMNISNGFSDLQKYNAMTTNRFVAGGNGNDVSLMTSYGPLSIAVGDTITVAFAIILGDYPSMIQHEADAVQEKYNQLFVETNTTKIVSTQQKNNMAVYPNPANDYIFINLENEANVSYQIFDVKSNLVQEAENISSSSKIDINNLKSGFYIIKIRNEKQTIITKFVKE